MFEPAFRSEENKISIFYRQNGGTDGTNFFFSLSSKDNQVFFEYMLKIDLEKRKDLHAILQHYPECPEELVLYRGPYAKRLEQTLHFIPIYYAGSLAGIKD